MDRLIAKFESCLTAKQVNTKPQSFRLATTPQTVVELSNHEVSDETPIKQNPNGPAKIVAPNYEETVIAQKPGVAEDNEERTQFDRTAKNSKNQTVKE